MPATTFAANIRRGQEEEWRRFVQEVTEERFGEYEDLRRRLGFRNESLWLLRNEAGETAVAYLEVEDPERMAQELADSKSPFDLWITRCLQKFHGPRASAVRRPGAELIFAYPEAAAGGENPEPARRPTTGEPRGTPGPA